jgi:predicted transcriptional regulator
MRRRKKHHHSGGAPYVSPESFVQRLKRERRKKKFQCADISFLSVSLQKNIYRAHLTSCKKNRRTLDMRGEKVPLLFF